MGNFYLSDEEKLKKYPKALYKENDLIEAFKHNGYKTRYISSIDNVFGMSETISHEKFDEVVLADNKTYVGGPYDRWEIVEQSPEKFVFRLEYDSLQVGEKVLQESITITAEAGTAMNKAEVVLKGEYDGELLVGGGIYMHDTIDHFEVYESLGTVFYEEDALSDKTAAQMNYEYNGSTSQGRIYITVQVPEATVTDLQDGNLIAVKPYQLGDTLTYYFGATWSEWKE